MEKGLYEKIIDKGLNDKIKESDLKVIRSIDKSELSSVLSISYQKFIYKTLLSIGEEEKEEFLGNLNKTIGIDLVKEEDRFKELLLVHNDKEEFDNLKNNRPRTSISTSTLFTGNSGPTLESELSREIRTADRVDFLVSFIKFSSLRLIYDDLAEFTKTKQLRVITTSYMGASDYKAILELSKLPNTEVRVSYDTERTRLHAKAYYFERKTGFSTAYIGSSNLSNPALSNGLEWNLKVSEYTSKDVINSFKKIFESYWNDEEFRLFEAESEENKRELKRFLRRRDRKESPYIFFDLRPYSHQKEILENLELERSEYNSYRNLVVAATGSGKTAVLMMTPYVLESNKVLIITPSRLVRSQIFREYSTLKTLTRINVLPDNINKPKVYEMKGLYKEEQDNLIENADVIIATDRGGLSLSRVKEIERKFDLVLIDEAHHVPAKTWTEILENISGARHVLFTATPFRMDKKTIKGVTVYNYPLSQAYKDGIFGEIQYIPIPSTQNKDYLIARKAESIFLLDREKGFEHFLMVRASSKNRAKELEDLYKFETKLNLKRIDSSMDSKKVYQIIDELRSKELDGIICVNMLGEGFDFPNLKIAAIHDPHKSLANTLQFIGRFARTNAENIDVAKFIAMNDEELVIENKALYKSDVIWQEIIIDLSENKINKEEMEKAYIDEYSIDNKDQIDSDSNLSLHTIRLNCHAKLYKVVGFDIHGKFPEFCNISYGPFLNHDDNTVVAIGKGYENPKWYTGDSVKDEENLLYIIHYQEQTRILYIYSQVKSEFLYEQIVEAFSKSYEKIPKHEMHRVLGDLREFEIFNSGMQNRFNESGESYRISAGSDVSQAIDPSTGRLYSAGHVFCKAISEEQQITIGYSSGSKIWSSAYANLKDFISWCDYNGAKIFNSEMVVKTNTNFDYLPIPKRLDKYPNNIYFADLSGESYVNPSLVYDKKTENIIGIVTDLNIRIIHIESDLITIQASIGEYEETITCDLNGDYQSSEEEILVFEGRQNIGLASYFASYPLIFRTTDDIMIQGIEISVGDPEAIVFSNENIKSIPWKEKYGTNVGLEFRTEKTRKKGKSIQDTLYQVLIENSELDYIIYDHSTGEMADFITIQSKELEYEVTFYHVKAMGAKNYNSSVGDIYEVVGQAIKSTIWLKSKPIFIQKIKSRRKSGHCEFKKGEYGNFLQDMKQHDKVLRGKIVVVQPSICKDRDMPDKIQEVLAATNYYISNSGKVKSFEIWGS